MKRLLSYGTFVSSLSGNAHTVYTISYHTFEQYSSVKPIITSFMQMYVQKNVLMLGTKKQCKCIQAQK